MTESTKTMQFSEIVEKYAMFIIDGMDYKTLEVFAFESLVDNITKDYESVDELIEEIKDQYDEETLQIIITG